MIYIYEEEGLADRAGSLLFILERSEGDVE